MDDNEDPLGKISRQLSAGLAAGASPDSSGQWTQFSGISPQTDQASIRNICSWNPMDLPDFTPLSQNTISDSNPNHLCADPGVFDFLNQSPYSWHSMNSSHQKFQVAGDLSGRPVDVSRNRVHSCSFDHQNNSNLKHGNFPLPSCVFHYDGVASGSNVPVHRQMSQPSSHSPFVFPDRSSRHSLSSASSTSILSNTLMTDRIPPNDVTLINNSAHEGLTHGMSVKSLPHVNLHQTPPIFDPSTPPPVFPLEKHSSENFQPASSHFSNTPNEDILNYLQMQDKINMNFDFGTTIDKGHTHFSSVDSTLTHAEGQRFYDASNNDMKSFDSSKLPSSDILSTSQAWPRRQESLSEPAVSVDSTKPSYSDIARTPKNRPAFGAKVDQPNVPIKAVKRDEKLLYPSVKRTSSGSKFWPRGSQGGEADQSKVTPTSKYGLDSFGDQMLGSVNHSSGSEYLAKVIMNGRRGSSSNVSSSVSSVDDVTTQGVTGHISSENSLFDQVQDVSSSTHKQTFLITNPAKSPLSSKPSCASAQPASKESLFFDPRRIFQYKNTDRYQTQAQSFTSSKSRGASGTSLGNFEATPTSDTILNNGKPTASTASSKLSSSACQHDYINNDLRDASKLTNQTAAESGQASNGGKTDEQHKQKESRVGKKSGGRTNGMHLRNKRSTTYGDKITEETYEDGSNLQQQEPELWPGIDKEKIEVWCSLIWDKLNHWGNLFINFLLNLLIIILGIVLYLASGAIHLFVLLIGKSWTLVKGRLFSGYSDTNERTSWASHDHLRRRVGLEENISLPATGEEAMKRLLACKGKDPYSILGLRADSTDEDIKKYYRRQAVLVHPDKNQELGAEEAFKILGHAFEMIGEPARRKQYDSHTLEANEAEAMREFAEMISKLQTKFQEAANVMFCDNCGGKHRRVPVERPVYSARFCQRCNMRHSAKEGDVWAESTMLGFYWHYFAVMDGHIFNITEWMKCHKEIHSHMKANYHTVMYRIDGSRRNRHHQQGEPNLEELFNRLFKSAAAADGQRSSWDTSHPGTENTWAQGGASSTAATAKKSRRKKKRH